MRGPSRHSFRPEIDAIAARQHGLILQSQLVEIGCSTRAVRRFVGSGHLIRVRSGLLRSPAVPVTLEQRALSSTLGRPGALAVTGQAAARLWQLDVPEPELICVVGHGSPPPDLKGGSRWRRRSELTRQDFTEVRGVRVTSIQWTLAELSQDLPERQFRQVLDAALSGRRVAVAAMQNQLGRMVTHRRQGTPVLRRALEAWQSNPEMRSSAESAMLRAIAAASLPAPVAGYLVGHLPDGQPIHVDFAWPSAKVALEVDGFAYHGGPREFQIDHDRDLAALVKGWTVVRVTAAQVLSQPARACRALAEVLRNEPAAR